MKVERARASYTVGGSEMEMIAPVPHRQERSIHGSSRVSQWRTAPMRLVAVGLGKVQDTGSRKEEWPMSNTPEERQKEQPRSS